VSGSAWLQFAFFGVLIAITAPLLGKYMYRVYATETAPGDRFFLPIERFIYRVGGIDPEREQRWTSYALSLLWFSLAGILLTYVVFRFQAHLPFNPDHQKAVSPGQSFNESISFVTNTDWQAYSGELTLSHFSQMFGVVIPQFTSAAVGMAVAVAFTRGLIRRRQRTLGNFWVDTVRSITRILLPISFVFAFVYMSQGVIQNFSAGQTHPTVVAQATHSHAKAQQQTIPGGPVASQVPIEALGDNGGGYFNANQGHPYQGPNPITNVIEYWLVAIIPFAFPFTFGRMVGSKRQGYVILASMAILFAAPLVIVASLEGAGNTKLPAGVSQAATATQSGGNLEGKDLRLGVGGSTLSGNSVTATSAGATNSAHESYTPLGGGAVLTNILLGEVSPGGDGSGLFGKLILVLVAVFLAGLMVGRTPEYLGKKIAAHDAKLVVIYVLIVPIAILLFSSIAIVLDTAQKALSSSGPHGLTEMVYTYTQAANNNGSAFAGISANTQWFNSTLGLVMLVGRYFLIIPVLAIGGSLVRKQHVPATAGTLRTDTPLFAGLIVAITLILVGLIYFPILALGPIVEHLAGHF
jgi:K+-transporting ATPase ATPase A chain